MRRNASAEEPKNLSEHEERDVVERTSVRARVIHEAIRRDGELELSRAAEALGWSGLAAGLAMGMSLLVPAVIRYHLPDAPWSSLIWKAGYPIGFLMTIVGKQQLFTENTLTPIIPLMREPTPEHWMRTAKIWVTVLCSNVVGAFLVAWFFASTTALNSDWHEPLVRTAHEATDIDFFTALLRGIPAGWLIAMIVWLRAATHTGHIAIVFLLTYVVALGEFAHIIVGSVEFAYLVFRAERQFLDFFGSYLLPVLLGNAIGGVSIVAALNHAQVVSEED